LLDTDRSMTFADLQIRVAEAIGQASYAGGVAAISTDPNVRDRVRRAINDAAAEISRAVEPLTKRTVRWSWLEPSITLTMDPVGTGPSTIAGDRTRYALPLNVFGFVKTPTFRIPNGYGANIQATTADQVYSFQQRSPTLTGAPQVVAIDAVTDVSRPIGKRVQRQLVFFPIPDQAYIVRFKGRMSMHPLVDDAERGPWPSEIDLAVVDRAIALMQRSSEKQFERAWAKSMASLQEAIELDRLSQAHAQTRDDTPVLTNPAVTVSLDGVRIL
jgi:hypothetical protein